MSTKKPALGKGLSALLENANTDVTSTPSSKEEEMQLPTAGAVSSIPVKLIEVNPFQPRTQFEKEALEELTDSIKEHGLIQPITVRKLGYNKYQIISGERRFRASQKAGLEEVPVYVRIANDQTMLEMAIIENIQRQDLNAIEVGLSFQRLIDECDLTQEQLSDRVGKNRSTIANYLRLLNLPSEIQAGIRDRKISMGHARALLAFKNEEDQINAFRAILNDQLSVRKVEELARGNQEKKAKKASEKAPLSFDEKKIENDLSFHFNSKIKISKSNKGNGKIVIPFADEEHLKRILDLLD